MYIVNDVWIAIVNWDRLISVDRGIITIKETDINRSAIWLMNQFDIHRLYISASAKWQIKWPIVFLRERKRVNVEV